MTGPIAGVILAAGMSTRFRRNKLLESVRDTPWVRWVVGAALRSQLNRVIVVVGHEAGRIRGALSGLTCEVVVNPAYKEGGQSSSVRVGLQHAGTEVDAVVIAPGDAPLFLPRWYDLVIDVFQRRGGEIVIAGHQGRPGHPILFSRRLLREALGADESTAGLRGILTKHRSAIRIAEAGSPLVLRDVDTPDDLDDVFQLLDHEPEWRRGS